MDTKTDRELIELAAKAVGGTLSEGHTKRRVGETWDEWEWVGPVGIQQKNGIIMHPLINDGDAFRLAVRLDLFGTPDLNHYLSVLYFIRGYDKYTLMRRAIVMAAAKIGEGME